MSDKPTWGGKQWRCRYGELQSRTKSTVVQSYSSQGPLLACPAGAEVLQLTSSTPSRRLASADGTTERACYFCLKEPPARLANKQDECTSAFFEGRYKSIAILDEEALLSVCAYIDLNPMAAGIVALPEESPHTSIKERVDHVKSTGRVVDV